MNLNAPCNLYPEHNKDLLYTECDKLIRDMPILFNSYFPMNYSLYCRVFSWIAWVFAEMFWTSENRRNVCWNFNAHLNMKKGSGFIASFFFMYSSVKVNPCIWNKTFKYFCTIKSANGGKRKVSEHLPGNVSSVHLVSE